MGTYQKFRGDPETKLFYILSNFMGGINTEFSDDASSDVDFESIINFDMDKLGTLNKRKGFGELVAISQIFGQLQENDLPVVENRTKENNNPETENDNIVYMKLLQNDNNCFRNLAGFSGEYAYREYQKRYGFQNNEFKLLLITTKVENGVNSSSTAWYYRCKLPELGKDSNGNVVDTLEIHCYKYNLPIIFNWDRTLMNMDSVDYYDKIWFTNNNKGVVKFDRSVDITSNATLSSAFSYAGIIEGQENNAYLPSIAEIYELGLGANLLCTDPLNDIKGLESLSESLQGVFVTTTDNKLITNQVIPVSEPIYMHIFYTGSSDFEITATCGDTKIELITSKVGDLSTSTKAVYKIEFKNAPNGEVEFKIVKTSEEASAIVEPFITYYNTGQLQADLEPVKNLNIGKFNMCMMENRVVYYAEDTMYFSDINRFDYVPCNNMLKVPIESTDKITKISFFKGVYIIFTKNQIYKMTGNWGSDTFTLEPVNTSLGCHAGHTVVPIEDTLYFTSPRGLFALKSSTFVEGMQNLKELDLKVKKLTSDFTKFEGTYNSLAIRFNGVSERAYALRYRDKYLLFYNNYDDKGDYAASNDLDVLAYQYDIGSFTTYRFEEKPNFLFRVDNAIESFSTISEAITTTPKSQIEYNFLSETPYIDLSGNNYNAIPKNDATLEKLYGLNLKDNRATSFFPGFIYGVSNGYNITLDYQINDDFENKIISNLMTLSEEDNEYHSKLSIYADTTNDYLTLYLYTDSNVYVYTTPNGVDLKNRHTIKFDFEINNGYVNILFYKDNMLIDRKNRFCTLNTLETLINNEETNDISLANIIVYNFIINTKLQNNLVASVSKMNFADTAKYESGEYAIVNGADALKNSTYLYTWGVNDTNGIYLEEDGLKLDGLTSYLELPNLNLNFINGVTMEFEGKILDSTSSTKILDLATSYGNDDNKNNNCSVNLYVKDGTIGLSTTSNEYVKGKIYTSNIDLKLNHKYKFVCNKNIDNSYTFYLYVDDNLKSQIDTLPGVFTNINRISNFIGRSNTISDNYLKAIIKNFKLTTNDVTIVPRNAIFEFDVSSTDFGKPIYIELITKAINMKYPQHLKKLKHIFVKAIGGNKYNEFFFELYGDGYLVNNSKEYYTYIDENGQVVYDYSENKALNIEERAAILGAMMLDDTKLGEGLYQTKKLIIPDKARNFKCKIYGNSSEYISFESFGFVCKLGKVKEG